MLAELIVSLVTLKVGIGSYDFFSGSILIISNQGQGDAAAIFIYVIEYTQHSNF